MTDTPKHAATTTEATDAEKRRQAYNAAERKLREKYRGEFIELVKAEALKLGVVYEPRKTESEKAEAKLAELLAAHPELRDKVGSTPA